MTAAVCPVCEAFQSEGLLCHSDTSALERELGDVAALVAELDISISKQARIGNAGPSGLARERTPINVGAMLVADDLGNTLTTWARDVGEVGFLAQHSTSPSRAAARILLNHIPEIRKHPAVVELVDEITDAIRQARRVVDRPADRQFVGPCLAESPDDEGRQVSCLEDLYARHGASEVRCKVCSTEHPVAERRAWLLEKAKDRLFTVQETAQMMGDVGGIKVTEASIRGYIHRGRIAYHTAKMIRLGDLLTVVLDEGERKSA
jgi:hypothetical protein